MRMNLSYAIAAVLTASLPAGFAADITGKITLKGTPPPEKELPLDPTLYTAPDLGALWRQLGAPQVVVGFARHLAQNRLALLTGVDQIDFETLRLLGLFQPQTAAGALEIADLYNAFVSLEANDIVNFSLELLPSVLETKRAMRVGGTPL